MREKEIERERESMIENRQERKKQKEERKKETDSYQTNSERKGLKVNQTDSN